LHKAGEKKGGERQAYNFSSVIEGKGRSEFPPSRPEGRRGGEGAGHPQPRQQVFPHAAKFTWGKKGGGEKLPLPASWALEHSPQGRGKKKKEAKKRKVEVIICGSGAGGYYGFCFTTPRGAIPLSMIGKKEEKWTKTTHSRTVWRKKRSQCGCYRQAERELKGNQRDGSLLDQEYLIEITNGAHCPTIEHFRGEHGGTT